MAGLIDFHSHILPCIDDGSRSLEMSIEMLRAESAQGVAAVIATPHFYPEFDAPDRFLAKRAEAETALRAEMQKYEGLPELYMGAEVGYFPGISDSKQVSELTIQGSRCMLIEMPMCSWSKAMYRELEGLYVKREIVPIIAHIDRYIGLFHNRGVLKQLEQLPVLVQANGEFFRRRGTSSMAVHMLKKNQIHLLGSDCHNLDSRTPNLGSAQAVIRKRLGDEALDAIYRCQKQVLWDEG